MADSLVLADQFELLGGGAVSSHPLCPGAVIRLGTGYDIGAPQPTVDFLVSQILDGELPVGGRTSNRQPTLPLVITAPDRRTLAGAKEAIMQAIDQQTFTLKWQRDDYAAGLDYPAAAVPNGTFETGVSGWTAQNSVTLAQSSTQAHSGTFSGRMTPNGTTASPQIQAVLLPVTPGQGVGISAWLFGSISQDAQLAVHFFDGSGTHLAGADVVSRFTVGAAWQQEQVAAITPQGAATAACYVQQIGTPPATTLLYVDDVLPLKAADFTAALAMPMQLDCYRALPSVPVYSQVKDKNKEAELTVSFQAAPFGRSDTPVPVAVASPLPGAPAPPAPVVLDAFTSVSGANWQTSAKGPYDGASARWNPAIAPLSSATGAGSSGGASYTKTFAATDITGRTALSVWAGFGTDFWKTWHRGPAVFRFTLRDANGHSVSFGVTRRVDAGNTATGPVFRLVSAAIPQTSIVDMTQITGYTITVTNRGFNTLRYTNLYLNHVTANPPSLQAVVPVRGAMYQVLGVKGTARTMASFQFAQPTGTGGAQVVQILPGTAGAVGQYQVPAGVSSLKAEVNAPGGKGVIWAAGVPGSGSGGGGGGGEYAAEPALAVTPLAFYPYNTGQPGLAVDGGANAFFTGDSVTVTAHRGTTSGFGNDTTGQPGGSGSTNSVHHNGAAGGAGGNGSGFTHGGGGGSSGGTSLAGNAGTAGTTSGGVGGAAVAGGGAGGNGSQSFSNVGKPGGYPGGGGGGASGSSGTRAGGAGGAGQVKVTYTTQAGSFSTLLLHSPGPQAPASLVPLVQLDPTDVPDGTVEYPVPSAVQGQTADFDGTYTLLAVASSFNNPTAARDLIITIRQYEYVGGPAYATTVKRSQFVPNNDQGAGYTGTGGLNGIVRVGEVTLPLKDVAPDNTSAYYTVAVTDTNTSDDWMDLIFIDSQGQTLLVNHPTPGAYTSYYVDEPSADRAIGRVLASNTDRSAALSVTDFCPIISGGPVALEPGDNGLLVYCVEGAPALDISYFDRYYLDRVMA